MPYPPQLAPGWSSGCALRRQTPVAGASSAAPRLPPARADPDRPAPARSASRANFPGSRTPPPTQLSCLPLSYTRGAPSSPAPSLVLQRPRIGLGTHGYQFFGGRGVQGHDLIELPLGGSHLER